MISFSKPWHGWLDITITDDKNPNISKTISASYLTDVPGDLLAAAIVSLKYNIPFCVELDSEGKGLYILLNSTYTGDLSFIDSINRFDVRYMKDIEIAEEIVRFTEENLEDIYNWLSYEDEEEFNKSYKEMINSRLKELKDIIEEQKKRG